MPVLPPDPPPPPVPVDPQLPLLQLAVNEQVCPVSLHDPLAVFPLTLALQEAPAEVENESVLPFTVPV